MTRNLMWFVLGLAAGVWLGLFSQAIRVEAQETVPMDVDLPIDTIYRGRPGTLIHVATIDAEPGLDCIAKLTFGNNPGDEPSIHLGNDIIVGPVTFTNVENGTFTAAGLTFVSTGPINVAVRIGDDGVFSAGFTLEVTCNPPTTTTTTTIPTTPTTTTTEPRVTTTQATAPPATPTTLSPPPVGGVDTGGGACADGVCEGLSPFLTWLLVGSLWAAAAGLVWVTFRYVL